MDPSSLALCARHPPREPPSAKSANVPANSRRRGTHKQSPMPNPNLESILQTLWPANMHPWSKICVVLDCARDERIFDRIERCHLDKCCLYAGRLPWVVQRAAPHLVVLERDD